MVLKSTNLQSKRFWNCSKSTGNMKKKTKFNGYVYDFSVDYDPTDVDDIKDIYKYLIKKYNKM